MKTNVEVPKLDIDQILYRETNGRPHARGVRERRVVANLIAHLEVNGFTVVGVDDCEEYEEVSTMKEAMEVVFNLDLAHLHVRKAGVTESDHSVMLVMGNDLDIIGDWNYHPGDPDGFNAAMERFDSEDYA